jgi:hypothetical protein
MSNKLKEKLLEFGVTTEQLDSMPIYIPAATLMPATTIKEYPTFPFKSTLYQSEYISPRIFYKKISRIY